MIEITLQLIEKVIKEWHKDYLVHMESYGLSDSMKPHVDDLINKFSEVLEINRDEFND